jgi:hypothetical protein
MSDVWFVSRFRMSHFLATNCHFLATTFTFCEQFFADVVHITPNLVTIKLFSFILPSSSYANSSQSILKLTQSISDAMAVPTTQVTPSANTQPLPLADGLRFYIVRPDSSMVPLVPADQLPFQLPGVPRQLSHQQLSHGKWTWVANASSTGAQLPVQDPSTSSTPKVSPVSPRFLAPDHNVIVQPSESIPVARVNPKPQVTPSLPTYSLDVPVPPQRLPVVEVQNSPRVSEFLVSKLS